MAVTIPVKYYNTYVLKKLVQGDISSSYNWYVEEARIKGGYNNVQTGLSPRAFLRSENNMQQVLGNSSKRVKSIPLRSRHNKKC